VVDLFRYPCAALIQARLAEGVSLEVRVPYRLPFSSADAVSGLLRWLVRLLYFALDAYE